MDEEILDNMNVDSTDSATVEETSVVEPNEEVSVEAENTNEASNVVENNDVNDSVGKTNHKQYTDLEKAQYSFHKQFSRQQKKHEQEMAQLREEFKKQLAEEIDKVRNPDKYKPKTRADFEYDDDYVKYLAKEQVNQALQEQMAQYQKEQEELARQTEVDNEYREIVNQNVKALYATPEAENEWRTKVGEAMQKGLGKMLDTDEDMSNFILFSPIGPKIMYELATNQKTVNDLFVLGKTPDGKVIPRSPNDRMRRLEALAERLESAPVINNNKAAVQVQKPVGRPGLTKEVKKDIFSDPKALLDMMS